MYSLFDKFLNNSLNVEEEEALQLLLGDKKNKKLFEIYLRDQRNVYTALQEPNLKEAYNKIKNFSNNQQHEPVRLINLNWFKFVAILFVSISIPFVIYNINFKQKENQTLINTELQITLELDDGTIKTLDENGSETIANSKGKKVVSQKKNVLFYDSDENSVEDEKLVYNKLTVPYGKKFQVLLSDGTRVFLNSGTSLRYPTKFIDKYNRDVYLDGEAFFEVKNDAEHPFTVITEHMNTRVLGTTFNVSSYNNENNTSSVLVSGAIDVFHASEDYALDKAIHIKPGQRAVFMAEHISVEQVNVQKYTAWKDGKLFFVDDQFNLILRELERHFNVTIKNNYTALNQEFFTGTFETENLDQILKIFQTYKTFEYTTEGSTITITK